VVRLLPMVHDPWHVQQLDPLVTRVQVNTLLSAAGLSLPTVPLAVDYSAEMTSVGWNPIEC